MLVQPAAVAAAVTQPRMQGEIPAVLVGAAAEPLVVLWALTTTAKAENARTSWALRILS